MTDHVHKIRSVLDSMPYTAPEHMNGVMRTLMTAVDGLLRQHGWTPKGLLVNLPEGVTHEDAQAAVDALAGGEQSVTARDRRVIAEVLDRLVQRDIDRRGIRDTFKPDQLGIVLVKGHRIKVCPRCFMQHAVELAHNFDDEPEDRRR